MLNKDRKVQLVISCIFSCLDSCNILYYWLSKKLLTKLLVLLNDCVHFVYAKHRFCWREGISVTKLAMEMHILPIRYRILYKISPIVFKCIHGSLPCRHLKRYPLQVRHKQDWGQGFILLLLQATALPESVQQ